MDTLSNHLTLVVWSVLAIGAIGYAAWSRHRFRTLRWGSHASYYNFRRKAISFLRGRGWAIEKTAWIPLAFYATRGPRKYAVICIPGGMELTQSRLRDLATLSPALTKGRRVLVITLARTSAQLVEEGMRLSVQVLWYRDLPTL